MKLFYSPGACSLAVHIALEELGNPYEIDLVSTSDGSTRSEAHLARNTKGRVPVLETSDCIITEATAIMTFLATSYLESDIGESNPMRLSRAIEWMSWLSSGVHAGPVTQLWRTERLSDDAASHESIRAKGRENLREVCDLIEQKMPESGYALDDRYSVADPTLLVYFRWGNRLGLDMKARYPKWTRHTQAMLERPAVQTVLSKEDISVWE